MAFVVQTDNGVVGANSYVSVADFRTYHTDRHNDVSSYSDADCQAALIKATEYLDGRWAFPGERVDTRYRTAWPRVNACDADDILRTGVPTEVEEACCEYALIALTAELNPTPTRDATGRPVQELATKVGPLEKSIRYATGAQFKLPKYPKADQRIRPLTTGGGLEIVRG